MLQIVSPLPMMIPLKTLSQSTFKNLRSSESVDDFMPGIGRCSLVLVWTIESISSSLLRSLGMEGDFNRMFLFSDAVSSLAALLRILLVLCLADLDEGGRGNDDNPLLGPTLNPLLGWGVVQTISLLLLRKSLYLGGCGEL